MIESSCQNAKAGTLDRLLVTLETPSNKILVVELRARQLRFSHLFGIAEEASPVHPYAARCSAPEASTNRSVTSAQASLARHIWWPAPPESLVTEAAFSPCAAPAL
jgi:hypothetical protein